MLKTKKIWRHDRIKDISTLQYDSGSNIQTKIDAEPEYDSDDNPYYRNTDEPAGLRNVGLNTN